MPLTPDQAAAIARRHGLTLHDAAGLLTLASDEADAERIAALFAGTSEADAERAQARDYTAALFGRTARTAKPGHADEPPAPPPGVVAREGAHPEHVDQDRPLRRFIADLFDYPDRDHR